MKAKPLPWNPDEPVKPDPRQLKLIPDAAPAPRKGCGTALVIGACGEDPLAIGAIQLCRPCYQRTVAEEQQPAGGHFLLGQE